MSNWLPGALAVIWLMTLSLVALIQHLQLVRLRRVNRELRIEVDLLMGPTWTWQSVDSSVVDPTQLEVLK